MRKILKGDDFDDYRYRVTRRRVWLWAIANMAANASWWFACQYLDTGYGVAGALAISWTLHMFLKACDNELGRQIYG